MKSGYCASLFGQKVASACLFWPCVGFFNQFTHNWLRRQSSTENSFCGNKNDQNNNQGHCKCEESVKRVKLKIRRLVVITANWVRVARAIYAASPVTLIIFHTVKVIQRAFKGAISIFIEVFWTIDFRVQRTFLVRTTFLRTATRIAIGFFDDHCWSTSTI